ncbi:FAD-binding domain-containing protein [Actibacterium sp. 188UL27-1]|uniref:FAD-binding domain-containing protein n=1 Tax=Actibacterium sp. 188UL27-1 TaxID=2786961 RepID=UPI0019582DEE|nr:FAD-binding domain-containing protein [Actibacterium sp. 188UL27-1]MBM7066976.1 deoxyribodipyrimidine photo-lyase [Actibacterium sp. 188UL27-1]
MSVLLWFKRDLRVSDHPALGHAASLGAPVLPLYVVEPEYWSLPDTSARQWLFTAECLETLRRYLAVLGAPLVVRLGDAVSILEHLVTSHRITRMVSHEETGNAWTFARDRRVGAWARSRGVDWVELPQSGIVRRLKTRDGWARQREGFVREPQLEVPAGLTPVADVDGQAIPSARDLGLAADGCTDRQPGGRDHALSLLGGFLTTRGQTYRKAMSSPVEGEWACSRLSPHLALGTLSGREAAQAAAARKVEVKGTKTGWSGSLSSFTSRLAWRDHFMQKLEDAPSIETHCLHTAYESLRPREPDAARLHAWEVGETGLPFTDACMRYLRATGWLNFRMRSMLTAVASYHLWLDWRATGPHLARMFTDYEPGIHWSQLQMQSGTTGMNTVRIYNPVKQGNDQDPTGIFTRRWVPELADVPDEHLQEPWLWDGAGRLLGKAYPEPLVDVKAAAKTASTAVWGVRRGPEFRAEANRIVAKHASRKEPGTTARFQRDKNIGGDGKSPRPKSDQLSLDL